MIDLEKAEDHATWMASADSAPIIRALVAELRAAREVAKAARKCMAWQTGSASVPFQDRAAEAQAWEDALAAYDAAIAEVVE
jgi:hypothetical protein